MRLLGWKYMEFPRFGRMRKRKNFANSSHSHGFIGYPMKVIFLLKLNKKLPLWKSYKHHRLKRGEIQFIPVRVHCLNLVRTIPKGGGFQSCLNGGKITAMRKGLTSRFIPMPLIKKPPNILKRSIFGNRLRKQSSLFGPPQSMTTSEASTIFPS